MINYLTLTGPGAPRIMLNPTNKNDPEQNLILDLASIAADSPDEDTVLDLDTIAFPDITYSFYPVYAALYQIPYVAVPLQEDFTIDFDDFPENLKALLLANPNAPTAIAVTSAEIENQLRRFSAST